MFLDHSESMYLVLNNNYYARIAIKFPIVYKIAKGTGFP